MMAIASRPIGLIAAAALVIVASGCSIFSEPRVETVTVGEITFLQMSGVPYNPGQPDGLFEGTLGIDSVNCAVLVDEDGNGSGLILPESAEVTLSGESVGVSLSGQSYFIGDSVSLGGGFSYPSEMPEVCTQDSFFIPNSQQ